MDLTDLVEKAVTVDFGRDDLISTYGIVSNDSGTQLIDERPFIIFVKAMDRGDFQAMPGCGIKQVDVEVNIEFNLGSAEQWQGRVDLLSQLAERVDDRLQAGHYLPQAQEIIENLSRPGLKLFGIQADKEKRRTDLDLAKERVIEREFICAQTQ